MSILNFFRRKQENNSASVAKERLQIIVAHERSARNQPEYLVAMQNEIIEVIQKYVAIDRDQVSVQLDDSDNCSVLELNVTLPQ